MTKETMSKLSRAAVLATLLASAGGFSQAYGQTPSAATGPAAQQKLLSLGEIESRLAQQGVKMKEIEIRDKVLEIEGYDEQGREIELVVDRRTGEILSRRFDD
jgi:uncharacterized membrane protein YkoI